MHTASVTSALTNHPIWTCLPRFLHWLIAINLMAAASMTEQGGLGHSEFGWITLALLLLQIRIGSKSGRTNPVLIAIALLVFVLNLTGWLQPQQDMHFIMTFITVLVAGAYSATVLFESAHCFCLRTGMGAK